MSLTTRKEQAGEGIIPFVVLGDQRDQVHEIMNESGNH